MRSLVRSDLDLSLHKGDGLDASGVHQIREAMPKLVNPAALGVSAYLGASLFALAWQLCTRAAAPVPGSIVEAARLLTSTTLGTFNLMNAALVSS